MTSHSEETVDFPVPPTNASALRVQADCSGLSDRGLVRQNNEDHFLVAQFGRYLRPLLTNMSNPPPDRFLQEGYGMVVADGVGGHHGGEIASEMAIQTLHQLMLDTSDWVFTRSVVETQRVMLRMAERYRLIDSALAAHAQTDPLLSKMATTMTLACSLGDQMVITHVGDSRAYLYRAGKLHQLTRDHTMAQELLDSGEIQHLAEVSESVRHALMRVLGSPGGYCEADVDRLALANNDQVLLCTDGLTEMLNDAAIADILRSAPNATQACQQLVAAALKNGGKDNVTVALARYRFL